MPRHVVEADLLLQLARAEQERQRAESALVQAQTSLQEMRQERAALLQEAAEKDVRIHQLHLTCGHLKEQVGGLVLSLFLSACRVCVSYWLFVTCTCVTSHT